MNQWNEKGIAEAVRRALAEAGYTAGGGCPAGQEGQASSEAENRTPPCSMTLRLAEELAARVEEKAREWGMRVVTAEIPGWSAAWTALISEAWMWR